MERLTDKHYTGDGYYMKCSERLRCEDNCGECDQLDEIIDRLGAYEDTGLEPEEIMECLDLIDAFKSLGALRCLNEVIKAGRDGRLVIIPEPSEGLECDLLEPMKVGYALKTEIMKLNMRLTREPKSVSHLDYTIIAALKAVLEGGGSDA